MQAMSIVSPYAATANLLMDKFSLSGVIAVFLGEMEVLFSGSGSDIDRKYLFLLDETSLVSLGGSIGAAANLLELVLGDLVLCGDLIWCITSGDCALTVAIFFCK